MDVKIDTNHLVSIEYPGVVQNEDKMLQTLGGIETVTKVYNDPNRRLDLRLRPDDAFCKCLHGDRFNTTNLLLKVVTRRRKKKNGENSTSSDDKNGEKIVRIEVVGPINTTYKFRSMADFQFLPMSSDNPEKTYESLLPSLIPSGLQPSSWLQEDCPLFIVPPLFSRLDTPASYHFRKDPVHRNPQPETEDLSQTPNVIGRGRAKRSGIGQFVAHEDPTPKEPTEKAHHFFKVKGNYRPLTETIRKAFETRPVWSRSALAGEMNLDYNRLKYVLPSEAYYFLNGPWRGLWVRYGYNPRLDPKAIVYQLLDLRIHITPGPGIYFSSKRSIHLTKLTTKISNPKPKIGCINAKSLTSTGQAETNQEKIKHPDQPEDLSLRYMFREGEMPFYRQIFYQLCDIQMEAVQSLLAKEKGTANCHERDGWCSPHFLEKCRDLMLKDVKKTAEKMKKEYQEQHKAKEGNLEEEYEESNVDESYEGEDMEEELMSDLDDPEDDPEYTP